MKFSVNIIEKNSDITKLILEQLQKQVDNILNKSISYIVNDIKLLVKNALINEPEYISLKAGTLKAEFGIYNTSDIDTVIDLLVNTLDIKKQPTKILTNSLSGGFNLTMIKTDDISGVIYTDSGNVQDTVNGYTLPWLEWLLLRGNETIVQNYSVSYNNSPRSRSGLALMVKSNTNWRVPPNFAGTTNDNWTTRAIDKIYDKIPGIIQANIENNL